MKRCDSCKVGIAEYQIGDNFPKEVEFIPEAIWGKIDVCRNCVEKWNYQVIKLLREKSHEESK